MLFSGIFDNKYVGHCMFGNQILYSTPTHQTRYRYVNYRKQKFTTLKVKTVNVNKQWRPITFSHFFETTIKVMRVGRKDLQFLTDRLDLIKM